MTTDSICVASLSPRIHGDLIDPATEKVYGTSPVSTTADVDDAYRAASAAFEVWGETTPAERHDAACYDYGFEDYTRIKHVMSAIG